MGSALLDTHPPAPAFAEASSDCPAAAAHAVARTSASPASTEALRRQVADRLAAHHRSRRAPAQPALALSPAPSAPSRASRIAAAVAERYAHSPSYRAYLAAEAERATQQAQAAAQIAALNAQAVAAAQQQLLDSLNQDSRNDEARNQAPLNQPQTNLLPSSRASSPSGPNPNLPQTGVAPAFGDTPSSPKRRRVHQSLPRAPRPRQLSTHRPRTPRPHRPSLRRRRRRSPMLDAAHLTCTTSIPSLQPRQEDRNDAEARRLDEEIAFRQSPVFEEPAGPPMPLPANLIEFPRQLVAPRKARPRYAEGPLRAAAGPAPGAGQLRIFEVDPAQISTTPVPAEAPAPQWTSIWLDAPGAGPADDSAVIASEIFASRTLSSAAGQPLANLLRPPRPAASDRLHPPPPRGRRNRRLHPSRRVPCLRRHLPARRQPLSPLARRRGPPHRVPPTRSPLSPGSPLGPRRRPDRRPHRTPAQPRPGLQRPRPCSPLSPLPGALLLLLRVHPRNALRPHRPLHLRRREPHPPRHAPPHPRRPRLRLPPRPRPALGHLRRRPPRLARPPHPYLPAHLLRQGTGNSQQGTGNSRERLPNGAAHFLLNSCENLN